MKHVQINFKSCVDIQELDAIQTAFIECGQHIKTISLPFVKLTKEVSQQIFLKMPELHLITLKETIVTRVEKDQVHVKKSLDKPKKHRCHVSPPRDEENNFNERQHIHRDFMETNRQRRNIRMRIQQYETHHNSNPGRINRENRRYLLFLRRHGRDLMMRRQFEH